MNLISFASNLSEWSLSMVDSFGYLGVFIVNFIGSSTIIFPLPGFLIVSAVAAMPGMNPWIVGVSAGLGAALGETTGYLFGKGGGRIIDKRYKEQMTKYKKWFKKDNIFFGIILFAATPLPDDILGLVCGMFNYDFKKFLLASAIGKIILNLGLAFLGFYGSQWINTVIYAMNDRSMTAIVALIIIGTFSWFIYRKRCTK